MKFKLKSEERKPERSQTEFSNSYVNRILRIQFQMQMFALLGDY